ncbi:uncharacterized protein LOC9635315 isoform X1 [Selaginella moellendorffii]|uniref:uncharacterized protein LOC9635315 isoform X1 n=1 Tax=Selaginella moellendorffii TaxID=88036 RepID=UPI000D1C23B0|nr:uncharacterized protein LOC9635315 isoform X1 [Selaginella moellendorffii]|eukprot:XP_024526481.1 uncharacterized protein LOC9635315 isoform X1 [Selaginella moellendorffii]
MLCLEISPDSHAGGSRNLSHCWPVLGFLDISFQFHQIDAGAWGFSLSRVGWQVSGGTRQRSHHRSIDSRGKRTQRLPIGGTNVVYLSSLCGNGNGGVGATTGGYHRCNHSCQVEHVWANLYRCLSTGSSHVCDKNCNQRILYDVYSSICRVSGQIFPLTLAEQEAARGVRRKRESSTAAMAVIPSSPSSSDGGGFERCVKRRCETRPFELERFRQIAVPASGGHGQASAMDLS